MSDYVPPPQWMPDVQWVSIDEDADPPAQHGDVLLGTVYLFGIPMHVQAVRIDPGQDVQTALSDPYHRFEGLILGDDPGGPYLTTCLRGWDGEYVVWLVPHGD